MPKLTGKVLTIDSEAIGLLRALRSGKRSDMHVIVAKDYFSDKIYTFFDPYHLRDEEARVELEQEGTQDGDLEEGIRFLMKAEVLIIQNGCGYDLLAFEKLFPSIWKFNYFEKRGKNAPYSDKFPYKVMDTLVMSQLLYPDRPVPKEVFMQGGGAVGAHSIEAHGYRMGRYKPENEDWSKLTDHMLHRCREDVHIGADMFDYLYQEWLAHKERGNNKMTKLGIEHAYYVEIRTAVMVARQAQRGFRLDMKQAWEDYQQIDSEMEEISKVVADYIPPKVKTKPIKDDHLNKVLEGLRLMKGKGFTGLKQIWLQFMADYESGKIERTGDRVTLWELTKKNGDYSAKVQKDFPEMRGNINDQIDPLVVGAYSPVVYEEKGLGSLDWVKEKVLYPRGWRGVNFSEGEQEWYEEYGEYKHPWSGKIDEASLDVWRAKGTMPSWCEEICAWYVLRSRRSVILNKEDYEYFLKNKKWKYQATLKRNGCRGLLARAYSNELGIEAEDHFALYGTWFGCTEEEWRVPAVCFSIGTNTFRMRHKFVVNIPSRGLWPLRHLFIAKKDHYILGADGAGLELRMLAHFMADALYTEIVLDGDIHSHNQKLAGLPSRDIAKTFIYAL